MSRKKKNMIKRMVTITILLISILISLFTGYANAEVNSNVSVLQQKISVENNLKTLSTNLKTYDDTRGVIYYLMSMINLGQWYDYAQDSKDYGFEANELTVFNDLLKTRYSEFNAKFSGESDNYKSLTINYNDAASLRDNLNNLIQVTANYATDCYSELQSSYNLCGSDEEKKEFLATHSDEIRALYQLSYRVTEERQEIRSYSVNTGFNLSVEPVTALNNNTTYSELISYGESLLEKDIANSVQAEINDGDTIFEKLTNSVELDGEQVNVVNPVYLAMFSCSAVYRPFVSTVGEKPFIYSLEELLNDSGYSEGDDGNVNLSDYSKLYNEACKLKKPVYRRDLNKNGKATGKGSRITVKEFLDSIKSKSTGSLCTVYGNFKRSDDSDAWSVYQDQGTVQIDDKTGEQTDQPKEVKSFKDSDGHTVVTYSDGSTKTFEDESKKKVLESTEATKTDDDTETSSNVKMQTDDGEEYELGENITNNDLLTPAIFDYGTQSERAMTNFIMMWNILQDDKTWESIEDIEGSLLYVNPFGDIVLQNDTVIIPGAANATFYPRSSGIIYYPDTAAFMNSYPVASLNSKYFEAVGNSEDKYIVGMQYYEEESSLITLNSIFSKTRQMSADVCFHQYYVGPTLSYDKNSYSYHLANNKKGLQTLKTKTKCMPMDLRIYNGGRAKIETMKGFDFEFDWGLSSFGSDFRTAWKSVALIVPDNNITIKTTQELPLFPLTESDDDSFNERASFIASRCYDAFTIDQDGSRTYYTGRLGIKNITKVFEAACGGSTNIEAFTKNIKEEYDSQTQASGITNWVAKWTQTTLDTVGQSKGVIGLKNAYQDTIFGNFVYYGKKFMPFIIVAVVLFFIVRFASRRNNIFYSAVAIVLSIIITYSVIAIIPIYLPSFLNGIINNTSDNLGYKALIMREEQYNNPYSLVSYYDENGEFVFSNASIDLYKIKSTELDEFCEYNDIYPYDLMTGSYVVLDSNSGLYAEGDTIKMNLDRLFASISITGDYTETETGLDYMASSHKHVGSCLDYYNCYGFMVDALINKLNKMTDIYNIAPTQLTYPEGLYKDSFLVKSYLRSDLVLNGDDLTKLKDRFDTDVYTLAKKYFPDGNLDYLGLSDFLTKDIFDYREDGSYVFDDVKETLWFKTMVRAGYFNEDGEIVDEDLLSRLIEQVNKSTEQFLLDYDSQMGYISDENMIKATCLYAMTEFNRIISSPTDMVYPQNINYEELKLENILLPIITKDYDRYTASNQNIVNYIKADFGIVGLILFEIVIILAFLITNIMRFGLPVLYILLLVCIIFRLAFKKEDRMREAFKGYLKVSGTIFVCYALFILVTSQIYRINNSAFCLFVLVILYGIFVSIMFTVLYSLATGFSDFGNANVNSNLNKIGKKLKLQNTTNRIKEAIQSLRHRNDLTANPGYTGGYGSPRKFLYSRTPDDEFDEQILDNYMRDRHGDSYKSMGTPRNNYSRRRLRRNKHIEDYNDVETGNKENFDKFNL